MIFFLMVVFFFLQDMENKEIEQAKDKREVVEIWQNQGGRKSWQK